MSVACAVDGDCALTRLEAGACCPTRCQPRAVAKRSAAALARWSARCEPAGGCPELSCAPRGAATAACVDGRCELKTVATE